MIEGLASFRKVLRERRLTPLYQPIVCLQTGRILGYEGLIRGPSNTPLHDPTSLFEAARHWGETIELERMCRALHIDGFIERGLKGRLFLNMSPDALMLSADEIPHIAVDPENDSKLPSDIVIEVTEAAPVTSFSRLRHATAEFRGMGLQIALDDLGDGFASLRLWSELRPDFVKIDRYFVHKIHADEVKRQFVASMFEIARKSGACVIAEGIETEAELAALQELGICYGQGYLLGRPVSEPPCRLAPQLERYFQRDPAMPSAMATPPGALMP